MSSTKIIKIIERLMVVSSSSTQAELATFIGISQPAIAQAVAKRKVPDDWLYRVAYQTGRRVEWLRNGDGAEFANVAAEENERYRRAFPPVLQSLIAQWAELSDAEQQVVDNAMKLLLSSDPETRALTVRVVESVHEHHQSTRQQRRSAYPNKGTDPA